MSVSRGLPTSLAAVFPMPPRSHLGRFEKFVGWREIFRRETAVSLHLIELDNESNEEEIGLAEAVCDGLKFSMLNATDGREEVTVFAIRLGFRGRATVAIFWSNPQ